MNIQFEAGLYGYAPDIIAANVCEMIKSAKRLVFTMHRVQLPTGLHLHFLRLMYNVLRMRGIAATLRAWRGDWLVGRMARQIAAGLQRKYRADRQSVTVMVHTRRDRNMLTRNLVKSDLALDFVVDFPLTFLNKAQIEENVSRRAQIRMEFLRQYQLDDGYKYIGMFGFLSENKGHHVAIEAMRFLPSEYRLLIFGGQHPMSIESYDFPRMASDPELYARNKSPYIASLIERAQQLLIDDAAQNPESPRPDDPRQHRVQFFGVLDDQQFIRGITAMDFVVLPYLKSGQGGSANASLALELRTRAVLSRNHAFMELARYYPGCFALVDMANPLQMAQSIHRWHEDLEPMQRDAVSRYNIENNILLHRHAFSHGAASADAFSKELTARRPPVTAADSGHVESRVIPRPPPIGRTPELEDAHAERSLTA